MNKKIVLSFAGSVLIISIFVYLLFDHFYTNKNLNDQNNTSSTSATQTNNPVTSNDFIYEIPKLPRKDSYTIILVGDSMIDVMGENLPKLRSELKNHYPSKTFGLFNYGFGSTTLESLMDRLTTETENKGVKYSPILSRQFDIIIVESFGHNPLDSDLQTGLNKQEKLLLEAVKRIRKDHPNSIILFLATIGANKDNYGKSVTELENINSNDLARIRNTYIENHIKFAENHNIPLINVYSKSQDMNGQVDPIFINKDSWIHPSSSGVELISRNISDYIYEQELIPH